MNRTTGSPRLSTKIQRRFSTHNPDANGEWYKCIVIVVLLLLLFISMLPRESSRMEVLQVSRYSYESISSQISFQKLQYSSAEASQPSIYVG